MIVTRSMIWSNLVLKVTSRTGKETGRNCWDTPALNIQARDNGDQTRSMQVGLGRKANLRAPSEQEMGLGRGRGEDGFLHVGLLLAKIRDVRRGKLEAVGAPGCLLACSVERKMRLGLGFEFKPGGVRAWSADMEKPGVTVSPERKTVLRAAGALLRL